MSFRNPTFKVCFHVEIVPPDRVFLFHEGGRRCLLEGRDYVLLAPYLFDREYSLDEIGESLKGSLSEAEIYYALLRLEEQGVIEEASRELSKPLQTFLNLLVIPLKDGASRLKGTPISLQAFGDVSLPLFEAALEELSLRIDPEGKLLVAVTDNYRRPELREHLLQIEKPCFLLKPVGAEVWIGPLWVRGKTACLDCLLEALQRNSNEECFVEKKMKREAPVTTHRAFPSTMMILAYQLAAQEIFKWVVQEKNSDLEGQILSLSALTPLIQSHRVIRSLECPTCGAGVSKTFKPLILESQTKRFFEEGGHRTVAPEQTVQQYSHLISPITGIVGFLKPVRKEQPPLLHTYKAEHNFWDFNEYGDPFAKNVRKFSAGKGKTEAQGKASCLCEAIERISMIFRGTELRKKGSYQQLKGEAIHPYSILLFSDHQYKIRDEWNRSCHPFHRIPAPFDEAEKTDWTPVWSLTEERTKWIATGLCYFDYPFDPPEIGFCHADSNGSAAGNTKEEAILQGFFELLERDSIAIWWYSRLERPGIDLTSFPDPHIGRLLHFYSSIDREVWAIDLTMDFPIPAMAVFSSARGTQKERILFGFGAHLDPNVALLRALTELNQSFPLISKETAPLLEKFPNHPLSEWFKIGSKETCPYLLPSRRFPLKRCQDYKRQDTLDLKEDILTCKKMVESKGLEMVVLEQTRPDIGLPVVKVFVPGLRHFWNRYAPGRLYDVPLQLGAVPQKRTEDELNPIPMFL